MKIYKLSVDSDNGFQAIADVMPRELREKDLYSKYGRDFIDCIHLDLDKGKKKTDALNMGDLSLEGFPVTTRFVELVKDLNLADIQFVKITGKGLDDYHFMFFNSDFTNKLDYEKCDLTFVKDFLGDIEELDIKIPKNRDGAIKTYKKHAHDSTFNKMIPKNGYHFVSKSDIENLDAFRIGHFDKSFYVSEKLKTILEEAKITGVNFFESDLFGRPEPLVSKRDNWWKLW